MNGGTDDLKSARDDGAAKPRRVLIAGCGYVGLPLGAALVQRGHSVFGLRRDKAAAAEMAAAGITPLYGDVAVASTLEALPRGFDWVVNCVSASAGGVDDYRRTYLEGTRNLLAWLATSPPRAFVYTSSTGVYGQDDGSVVTEESPATPEGETNRVLVATEALLLEAARTRGFPAMVLRCSGIYGPGRGYWLREFLAGRAVMEGTGDRWLNMIHRDDVGTAVMNALERGKPGEIFNVSDDEPARQRDVFAWLAQRLGRPMPPSVPESATTRRRGATNKAVSNRKLRLALGCELNYPTYRQGYEAELAAAGTA
jgi:nucleoside-diphosphate-sugar epimerase